MMNKRKYVMGFGVLLFLMFFSAGVGISIGSFHIPLSHSLGYIIYQLPFGDLILTPNWTDTEETIISQIRFPRVIIGLLVGASLSLAGVAFQGVLRNPLADPYILGVSAGASVGAALVISLTGSFALWGAVTIPLASFVGAILAILSVFWIGKSDRKLKTETLILAGVVVNSFFGAILIFLESMVPGNKAQQIMLWLLGSLGLRGIEQGLTILPFFLLGLVLIWSCSRELNSFTMGEKGASSLGVNVERTKWILLLTASLLTASAVSFSGIIGFVGLVIPHVVRMLIGPDHRLLIPFASLAGGVFLVLCDAIARSILSPLELSVGVVTALVGAPFFGWQLHRNRRKSF